MTHANTRNAEITAATGTPTATHRAAEVPMLLPGPSKVGSRRSMGTPVMHAPALAGALGEIVSRRRTVAKS
jgi:hypothetical protein